MNRFSYAAGITGLNLLILTAFYFYFSSSKNQTQVHEQSNIKEGKVVEKYRIAILRSFGDNTDQEICSGIIDTLNTDANFIPEIKIYDANGKRALMRSCINDAINQDFDAIISIASQASQMAREMTKKRGKNIPVVFCGTGDPIQLGLIDSVESSGNNLTGVSAIGMEWIDMMIDLIPTLLPQVKHVFIPYDPTGLGGALEKYKTHFDQALMRNGIKSSSVQIFETNEVIQKTSPFIDDCDLVLVLPDGVVQDGIVGLSKLCQQRQKGLCAAHNLALLSQGVSFSFGYRVRDIGVQAAHQLRMVLEDKQAPTDVPLNPMNDSYRIALSRENAQAQGLLKHIDKNLLFFMESGEVQ